MSSQSIKAVIDFNAQVARFSGPGTFAAKEVIKTIGPAKWLNAQRTWEVSFGSLDISELKSRIPQLEIEELVGTAPAEKVEKDSDRSTDTAEGLSVHQLILGIKDALARTYPSTVCVYGVISSIKKQGERAFIELVDQTHTDEKLHCVIWNGLDRHSASLKAVGFDLEQDLQVMFEVKVGLSQKTGSISLTIVRIIAEYTLAKLAAERDKTNERLKQEGIFGKNKETQIPFLPRRLGILTSSGGTVIHDFKAALDTAQFGFELFWLSVNVQGASARASVLAGIRQLQSRGDLDAILIFRGGGSRTELAIFNDYEIAKAVCLCRVPVFSAIGHEADQCSLQDVSFRGLGVPKDIGRFFADIVIALRSNVASSCQIITAGTNYTVNRTEQMLRQLCRPLYALADHQLRHREHDLSARAMQVIERATQLIQLDIAKVDRARTFLTSNAERVIERAAARLRMMGRLESTLHGICNAAAAKLEGYSALLAQINPEAQLRRGFAMLRKVDGSLVTGVSKLQNGEMITIALHDGGVDATVIETHHKKEN